MRPLNAMALSQLAEQHYRTWYVEIDPALNAVEDLFRPQFWANCTRLANRDMVRVRATDDSFDVLLVVQAELFNGKPARKFRLWGGISNDALRVAEAKASELVPTVLNGKPVPRIENGASDGWRIIGFAGEVAAKGYVNEAAATADFDRFLKLYGIRSVAEQAPTDLRTGEAIKPKVAPPKVTKPATTPAAV